MSRITYIPKKFSPASAQIIRMERDRIRDEKRFFPRPKPTREEKATSLGWRNYP